MHREKVSGWDAVKIILRVAGYFQYFKKRVAAKLGLLTFEHIFRLMIMPWPIKIVIDHVILGQAIIADGSGFPSYIAPFIQFLHGMTPVQIMSWMLLFGVITVAFFGMTLNRTTGTASDAYSSAAVGAVGVASALTAEGQDTATQTENRANWSESALGGLIGLFEFKLHLRLSQSLTHVLRTQLASHIVSLPITSLDERRIGDSIYRIAYDSTGATAIFHEVVHSIYGSLLLLAITIGIMQTSYSSVPEVIVVGLLVGPLTFLLVTPLAGFARRRNQASRVAGANTTSTIEEGISNTLAVQSLGANRQESERFDAASRESFKRFRGFKVAQIFVGIGGTLAFMIGQIIFFVVMSGHVVEGTYTAGDYFVVLYYFFVISAVCFGWGWTYTVLQEHIAGMARVFHVLDLRAEKTVDGYDVPEIQVGLVMENVSFTYPDGRRALRNVNLEARLGEIVALVGPTGAGKTTLAYLVPAMLQATKGRVSIDGADLKDVSVQSLRQQVSYVFQETQLFSDSIFENIRYGNQSATLDEVKSVARTAGAHEFITALPDGYGTHLGTVTSKLSVGQKQRLSIARGLLRQSRILILDEPTSALDPETEAYLVDALHEAAKDKLVIIIAHRLSTISRADTIHFLDAGEILESGSHEELMSRPDGRYRQYVDRQTSSN